MRISCPLVSAACLWALASGAARAQQPAALPVAPQPGVQAVWGFGTLGSGVGLSGIVVAHNNGAAEIWRSAGYGAEFGRRLAVLSGTLVFSAGAHGVHAFVAAR